MEARQYQQKSDAGVRFVVPTLFGFTEQIRAIKRETRGPDRKPVAVDWNGFKANAQKRGTDEQTISSMQKLYAACESLGAEIAWGRGIWIGSFNPKWPAVHRRAAPFSVYADGNLDLHFSSYQDSPAANAFITILKNEMAKGQLVLPADADSNFLAPAQWLPKVDVLTSALGEAVRQSPAGLALQP